MRGLLRWFAALGVCSWLVVAACGGRSDRDAGSGAGAAGNRGCVYGGSRYSVGETFGACDECFCLATGEVACIECYPGNAGSTSTGGAAGNGSGGSGAGSSGGEGGETTCAAVEIERFCVRGVPSSAGEALMEGMPLVVELEPAGCYSSSCTRVVESACSYLGTNGTFAISPFVCVASPRDAHCTPDCGGAHTQCAPGIELAAGDYVISLAPSAQGVRFSVPSVVTSGELCWARSGS